MRIDSHQHFWQYSPEQYPWMTTELRALRRDYLPNDLAPLLTGSGLDGSVVVQARQNLEESRWLLALADQHSAIKGVVGWVDLQSGQVDDQLAELAKHPRFVGVRHVVQDEPDDRFMLRPAFVRGLGRLKEFGLAYDLLLFPKHLPAAAAVVQQLPEQRFVLDHAAKPFIRTGALSPWSEDICELARHPNVFCKLSGLVTEARWRAWTRDDFRPYLDVVFEAFGEGRLMFGSDWPVCLLAGEYVEVFRIIAEYCEDLSEGARRKIFGENACGFYGLT